MSTARDRTTPLHAEPPDSSPDPIGAALAIVIEPIVRRAVSAALTEHATAERRRPERVDCTTMAQLIDCSPAQIHRLCREGMPHVRCGEVKRFHPAAVYEWLEQRTAERARGTR